MEDDGAMRSDSSIRRPIIGTHASGLLTIMVATLSSAACAQSKARDEPAMVVCAGGRSFQIEAREKVARIFLDGRELRLTRRASSLGQQYRSSDAALIIDGDYVAFVLNDDLAYEDCGIRAAN
jgi:hypothetical protein